MSWYARRACQYMLLTAVPVIAQLPSTNYVRNEWCTALANAQPPVQPKWGGEELLRRRRCCDAGNATDRGLDEIVKAAATSADGRPIFPSEGGQDRFLWLAHFQYLKRPIVYADFGSNNAVFTSNTFFLDQCLGASGVCVEANPRLKDAYHWRSCSLVNTCLSDAAHQVEFAFQDGVSTRSGILKDNKSYKNPMKRKPALVVNMTCTTGAQVLAASSITHIDYLDLDAEGHELAILKGMDWEAVTIDIILCEANDQRVRNFLKTLGYRPYGKVHYDDIYLRAGFTLGQPAPAAQNHAVAAASNAGAAGSHMQQPIVLPKLTSKGLNNYKMEFRHAALFARLSGRALCLPDMIEGKTFDPLNRALPHVRIAAVYRLEELGRFVTLASRATCHAAEQRRDYCVDAEPHLCQRPQHGSTTLESYVSAGRVKEELHDAYGGQPCIRLTGCLWSNYTLHVLYFSLWQHLLKPPPTRDAATHAAERLFDGQPYVALHWRFEETKCARLVRRSGLGLCYRSPNGTHELQMGKLVGAVERMRAVHGTRQVLLATDGRDRGYSKRVDELRRLLGAGVVELTVDCPNCTKAEWWPATDIMPAATAVSEVEQQLVAGARFALGSAVSSWFWEACFTSAMSRGDVPAFEVALEAEAMQFRGERQFPVLGSRGQALNGLPFGFLGVGEFDVE